MNYKDVASAEELGIQKVVRDELGEWLVLDKGESDQVILIPFTWDFRKLVNKDEL